MEDWSSFSAEKAAVLKAFVDFVLGSEGPGMLSDFSFVVVPAAMNTWQSVWDNTITKPTGFVPLTFESNTEKWVGQGANVVSSKRNSYSLWKLGDLESAAAAMKLVQAGQSPAMVGMLSHTWPIVSAWRRVLWY